MDGEKHWSKKKNDHILQVTNTGENTIAWSLLLQNAKHHYKLAWAGEEQTCRIIG